jgi:hypothetical protein
MTFAKANVPIAMDRVSPHYVDMQILRTAISAELDAITLYEQMGHTATDQRLKLFCMTFQLKRKLTLANFKPCL